MTAPAAPETHVEGTWLAAENQESPPHRMPPHPGLDLGPALIPNFRVRATWPCLGPALWMAGVLLWSYIAFGRLVLNRGFPELAAIPIVLFCSALGAYAALERSLGCDPAPTPHARRTRIVQATALGFGLFLGAISLAVIIGLTSGEDLDAPLSLLLTVAAVVAVFVGRRTTQAPWLADDPARRALGSLLWLASVALTLLAWAS